MELTRLRRAERAELMRTLVQVGPDAPTLCAEWSTADLSAHLVASERYAGVPLAFSYPLRAVLPTRVVQRAMVALQSAGQRQLNRAKVHGWQWLLTRLADGPPAVFRWGSIALVRLVEEWIHHEDVRRANGLQARESSPELDETLWQAGILLTGFAEFRPGREGVEAALPDGRTLRIGDVTHTRVEGPAGEILLFVAGRTSAANVTVSGDPSSVKALNLSV